MSAPIRLWWRVSLILLGVVCLGRDASRGNARLAGEAVAATPADGASPACTHAGDTMTDAGMQAAVNEWFATHPAVGPRAPVIAAAADTFLAAGFLFNADGRTSTAIDTVRIWAGQTILWKVVSASHTTTNGTGAADPQAGQLWDQPLDILHPEFAFTFATGGTFRFFCRIHEIVQMRGVVIVRNVSDVVPLPGEARGVGFVTSPLPNPSPALVTFQFAQRLTGRARAVVYDASGRQVAVPVDRQLPPGTFAAVWDGRASSGVRAAAGVYYVRLAVPGFSGVRRVVLAR